MIRPMAKALLVLLMATTVYAIANIWEAIIGCLEVRAEQGMPLTVRTVEVDVAVA